MCICSTYCLQFCLEKWGIFFCFEIGNLGDGIGYTNRVKLRQALLVMGSVTTFGGSTILVLSRPLRFAIPLSFSAMSPGDGF